MDDVLSVGKMIDSMITDIGTERRRLDDLAKHKARTKANWKKTRTTTMVSLRAGMVYNIDDVEVGCKSETNLKSTAEGVVSELEYDMDVAESAYKNCIVNLDCLKAQLNAKQSIYRHLDNL